MRKTVTNLNDSIDAWKDKKILIVEDVVSNYSYLAATLRKSGAQIFWAKSGEEAIAYVSEEH
ncbi:MAG TPA: response regulator, partial [Bacteroidales bacterium]|nr:response regulator [Bacteroidales bacterium]